MKIIRLLALTVLLSVAFAPLHAQANLPPTLDPTQFLADSVQLVSTKPILNADDATHTFFYFDGKAWKAYPYPDGLASVDIYGGLFRRSNGTYVASSQGFYAFGKPNPNQIWIFDPRSGTFTSPESACGLLKDLPGEGKWVLYQSADQAPFQLCFTETGEMKPPFPADVQAGLCNNWHSPPATSPDGQWVVFADCGFDPNPDILYAYNVKTDQLIKLGTGPAQDNETVEVDTWVDSTHPVFHIYSARNPAFYSVLIADVTQPNSLRLIVDMLSQWPMYSPDMQSLEWFPNSQAGIPGDSSGEFCQLHHFNLKTQTLTLSRLIPHVCGGIPILDGSGDYLYRSVTFPETGLPATATLTRYNLQTGKTNDLYIGEIEWLQSVSPDGRYALLILDNNGKIEYPYDWEPDQYPWDEDSTAWTAIFDLQTRKIVYQLSNVANTFLGGYPTVDWLGNDQILVTVNEGDVLNHTTSGRIVTLHNPIMETGLLGQIFGHYNENNLLLRDQFDNLTQIDLFNISAGRYVPITRAVRSAQYQINLSTQTDGTLELIISDAQQADQRTVLADWLVRPAQVKP